MNIPITEYLHQKLTEVGTAGFEQLAIDTGVKVSFIRKFFYGGRKDPRVNTVQPLLDHFFALDIGPGTGQQSQQVSSQNSANG